MSASVATYTTLITSEHADKPNYTGMVGLTAQPWADGVATTLGFVNNYDVDGAIGAQLDTIGLLVGASRRLDVPLTGVYFSLDTPGLGFDTGLFQGPLDPSTGINLLPDDAYRLLIKARIANNHWDGSKLSAYSLSNTVYNYLGYQLFIEDHADLTITIGLLPLLTFANVTDGSGNQIVNGAPADVVSNSNPVGAPTPLIQALLQSGALDLKPATIKVDSYIWPSAPGSIFAFDLVNDYFDGFDRGIFASVAYTDVPKVYPQLFSFDYFNNVSAGFDDGVWANAGNSQLGA